MVYCAHCGKELPEPITAFCPHCGNPTTASSAIASATTQAQPQVVVVPANLRSPGLAAVIGFLIPGLGHIYNGQIGTGIIILIVTIFLAVLWLPLVFFVAIFSCWESYSVAKKYNESILKTGKPPQ